MKTIRASIQSSIVDLEPLHANPDVLNPTSSTPKKSLQVDIETAVTQQELMASREERADLRAKVYLLEKEKTGLDLAIADRISMEQILRSHVQHLQEELGHLEHGRLQRSSSNSSSSRESHLKQRVESLLDALDKVTKNSEVRQRQNADLIDDLKRANRYEGET